MLQRLRQHWGRLHVRLIVVNAVVLLVPIAGLEFARLFERELLRSLERDMRNQAITVRRFLEDSDPFALRHEAVLIKAAQGTRTRVRVLDRTPSLRLDSHRHGPPEGEEPAAPSTLLSRASAGSGQPWQPLEKRSEIRAALTGERSAYTRVRAREPSVFLFVAEPIFVARKVVGVVYVTRSTLPVMAELYRIRSGLQQVLLIALAFTVGITLWLAYSITRPLERLSKVATRIAGGEHDLTIPVSGSGELRELGLALRAMTERIQQRMAQIAEFASDVAHGFKSPLTSIRGAAELLAQGAADDPAARQRFLRNIELDSERLDRLVTRLLTLSRIEASTEPMHAIDLRALLEEVAHRSSTPDVAIAVRGTDRTSLRGRKTDLATAFANLMDNAVKFSPPKTTVDVELSATTRHAQVRITDAGPGVPSNVRPRLFQRFFTTDADHGTGLGLAIVKSVIEAHGGRVGLEEPSGPAGACFLVELPL